MIRNDAWVGSDVTIMSGGSIGDGAVLSANAQVVKDVMPYEIVGGNPAKILKQRFQSDIIDLLLKLKWWDLPLDDLREISHHLCFQPDRDLLVQLITKYRF